VSRLLALKRRTLKIYRLSSESWEVQVTASGTIYEFVMIHMVTDSVIVESGDSITPGQPIGEVNCTGAFGGDHLHLQVYEVTYPINPITNKPMQKKVAIDPVPLAGGEACSKKG
ncbi:M23 family metallopeptidase, partial [Idiomarina sp. ST10R2A5]|uniref:M23 family metallopeptidase n=1 Tax=Idiomarina sp. ST10R2A5 TaxID=3418368 RepID=UPI003EC50D71